MIEFFMHPHPILALIWIIFWGCLITFLYIRGERYAESLRMKGLYIDKETGVKIWYPEHGAGIILNNHYSSEIVSLINSDEDYYRVLKMKAFW